MSSTSKRKRRRRKPRAAAPPKPAPAPAKRAAAKPATAPIDEQRPPAPWGSFPLVEVVVAFGLVLFVIGFFFVDGPRGTELFATGLVIASLAGLELSIREHLAGYRSHSLLLAGAPALAAMLGLYYVVGLSPAASLAGAAAVFAISFAALARTFRRRAGRMVRLR